MTVGCAALELVFGALDTWGFWAQTGGVQEEKAADKEHKEMLWSLAGGLVTEPAACLPDRALNTASKTNGGQFDDREFRNK